MKTMSQYLSMDDMLKDLMQENAALKAEVELLKGDVEWQATKRVMELTTELLDKLDAKSTENALLKELMRKMWNRIPPWDCLQDPDAYKRMMGDIADWVTQAKLWPTETPPGSVPGSEGVEPK